MERQILRLTIAALTIAVSAGCHTESPKRVSAHPLDPLSKEELKTTVAVLRDAGKVADSTRFVLIHLHEPPKAKVLAGEALPRQAFAVLYDWANNTTSEAVVDLSDKELVSWKKVPGVQPAILPEDDHPKTAAILRADPRWLEAIKKRGIKDLDNIGILGYPIGAYATGAADGHRRAFVEMFAREYGPLDDLTVIVDLTDEKIIKWEDRGVNEARLKRSPFAPTDEHDMGEGVAEPPRERPRRFQVHGHEVRWQHWRFRFSIHPRVGLVLHTVRYEDQGKERSVLYRACLSEMVVPYGDPHWTRWCPFDGGEYGLGVYAKASLNPGRDAPRDATYFSAWLHDRKGEPLEVPRAVALYEQDGGVLWRHGLSGQRARQLVLSSFVRVDEYDYGFNWIFHEDGTLEMQVLLTGRMNVKDVERTEDEEGHEGKAVFGHLVEAHREAPNHQHFFNFRLDLDVDGAGRNSVLEMNTEALPEREDNPYGNGFVMKETQLSREREAQRRMKLATNRKWKIVNTCVTNALGQPTGYVLVPGENSVPHATAKSYLRRHAGFVNSHLWVTPYRSEEMYAAGDYVNGGKAGQGLPEWTSANRPIEDEDIVVWYTLGVTHVPRPEEWPLMPVHTAGFKLVPAGFFARNPTLKTAKPK
ncbi:MAG TPA: primary-amine oxidase [Gemmataceae bacterium]|jgi:primary-amine oxidase